MNAIFNVVNTAISIFDNDVITWVNINTIINNFHIDTTTQQQTSIEHVQQNMYLPISFSSLECVILISLDVEVEVVKEVEKEVVEAVLRSRYFSFSVVRSTRTQVRINLKNKKICK